MLNEKGQRELCYVVKIDEILPIAGADNIALAAVGGWRVIVKKTEFAAGDKAIYFEIDSKVPETDERFEFLRQKGFKVKPMKLNKFNVVSQGLLMPLSEFPELGEVAEGTFLTSKLGVTYSDPEDEKRKKSPNPNAKYNSMAARHAKLFKKKPFRWLMKRSWGRKLLFIFFGKKKDNPKEWPVGKFPGVAKTDQERSENMPWVLKDKTPFIVTQKCDGSSGTFILERIGKKKFEFYVCSRNVRMASPDQETFYKDKNYYWEVAKKYDIENKMRQYLEENPDITFVCWQGEICAPGIQKNPHHLKETHLYCFHWTDSKNGRLDIREAEKLWKKYMMEVVPIINVNYIMPDDFEEFKKSADGYYDSDVCEGHTDCRREGLVYYKTTDPTFSFKNVSIPYILNH